MPGYRGPHIRQYCEQLGHVVLIPHVSPPGQPKLAFSPAQRQRYEQRRLIEQFFALLKDHFGLRSIRVPRPRPGFAPGPTGHSDSYARTRPAALSLKLLLARLLSTGRPASHGRDVSEQAASGERQHRRDAISPLLALTCIPRPYCARIVQVARVHYP